MKERREGGGDRLYVQDATSNGPVCWLATDSAGSEEGNAMGNTPHLERYNVLETLLLDIMVTWLISLQPFVYEKDESKREAGAPKPLWPQCEPN